MPILHEITLSLTALLCVLFLCIQSFAANPTGSHSDQIITLEETLDIEVLIQEIKILELENIAHKERFIVSLTVLVLLLIVSSLFIFMYHKIKEKNKLLMTKTLQLKKSQVIMKRKIADYQKKSQTNVIFQKPSSFSKNHSAIDKDVHDIILTKLENLEKKLFFLDTDCSLHQLAEKLKTNPKYLSQVINQGKNTNFNNYINELRINYLLSKLLTDPEFKNNKLNYIAVSLGFNNLNTFNSAFKKRLGTLPSNFIKELNNGHNKRKKSHASSFSFN